MKIKTNPPKLTKYTFEEFSDVTEEKINYIYKDCPKTLELIIYRVSGLYDVAGVTVPLTNQLRDIARAAQIQTKGEAKAIVTPDI